MQSNKSMEDKFYFQLRKHKYKIPYIIRGSDKYASFLASIKVDDDFIKFIEDNYTKHTKEIKSYYDLCEIIGTHLELLQKKDYKWCVEFAFEYIEEINGKNIFNLVRYSCPCECHFDEFTCAEEKNKIYS